MARAQEKTDIYQKYRLKRTGRNDENDIIFFYGKIHGIENIIFLDKETLDAVRGNPAKLQLAINNVQVPSTKAHSYEELMKKHNENLKKWKEYVEKLPIYGSDKKKMLALPFYAAKRTQNPDPKPGQWQYDAFKEMFGKDWNFYEGISQDNEKKPTLFDYENFFPKGYLEAVDTESEDFKNYIKRLNYYGKTSYEQHLDDQENFRGIMPLLSHLTEKEGKDFLHLVQNNT